MPKPPSFNSPESNGSGKMWEGSWGGGSQRQNRYQDYLGRCYTCETVFPFLVKYFFYLFIYIIS
jgi:hypothetical protein